MQFLPFCESRSHIHRQYARLPEMTDSAASEALYRQLQDIYYTAPSKPVGKGLAIRHYFQNVSLFIRHL